MIESIIDKKENKQELTYDEIRQVVDACVDNTILDHQISSLLKAISLNEMSDEETINLIDIILDSNHKTEYQEKVTGKYSVGDIDDKTTLILAAIASACGIRFVGLSNSVIKFLKDSNHKGLVINDRMRDFTFIDKIIIPIANKIGIDLPISLTAANTLSKVLLSGITAAVIEIRSSMKDIDKAYELANLIIQIGKTYDCRIVCFVTNGDITLGNSVGSILNLQEAVDILNGFGPNDMKLLLVKMASYLISAGKSISLEDATNLVIEKIIDGSAYGKLVEIIEYSNDIKLNDHVFSIKSNGTGFIKQIDTLKLHDLVCKISGSSSDTVDDKVGIVLSKKEGDYVLENEELAKVYLNKIDLSISEVLECFEITDVVGKVSPLINKVIE